MQKKFLVSAIGKKSAIQCPYYFNRQNVTKQSTAHSILSNNGENGFEKGPDLGALCTPQPSLATGFSPGLHIMIVIFPQRGSGPKIKRS